MPATNGQMDTATAVLGKPWQEIAALCRTDLAAYGVLPSDRVNALPNVAAPDVKPGDLVAIWAHQRYRAARVWKVGSKNVSALYVTPSNTAYPNNITGKPAGLIARA